MSKTADKIGLKEYRNNFKTNIFKLFCCFPKLELFNK